MRITKQQHMQACSVSLPDFLTTHHPDAVICQYGSVILKSDVAIQVKDAPEWHGYIDFRTGQTGNNIDYLIRFLGYDYVSAISALLSIDLQNAADNAEAPDPSSRYICPDAVINLPEPEAGPYRRVYAFLLSRKIPADVIGLLIKDRILYQAAGSGNCVFVTNQADYAEIRGTSSYADRRCRHRSKCAEYIKADHGWCSAMTECPRYKPDPFHGCMKSKPDRFWYFKPSDAKCTKAYICEAAIDAVSLYVLQRDAGMDTSGVAYVSIGGVGNHKTIDRIASRITAILAVDNDEAGEICRKRNQDLESVIPVNKDWNEDLQKGVNQWK